MRGPAMPRRPSKARDAPKRQQVSGPLGIAADLLREGYEVTGALSPTKRYRCPYCEGVIALSTRHVVAFAAGHPQDRRHYHTACWRKEGR